MATTPIDKATFQTTLRNERCDWLDANGGVTLVPMAQPVTVTSRVGTEAAGSGSGTRTATAVQTVETKFDLRRQYPPPDPRSWSGNFAPNVGVLVADTSASRSPRQITVTLSGNVWACGVQVQPAQFGAYTATVVFKDAGGATLLSLSLGGLSTPDSNDTAVFFGAQSTEGIIRALVITSTIDSAGIAINGVDLCVPVPPPPAPPPPPTVIAAQGRFTGSLHVTGSYVP